MNSTGTGHGKAIVVGEHHVMTGATALALGLPDFHTSVMLETTPLDATSLGTGPLAPLDPTRLSLDWPDAGLPEDVRRDTLAMIARACELAGLARALRVTITSTVPIRRGLGSSAALAVACVRAVHGLQGTDLTADRLLNEAREVECLVHGRSSGLDPAAAAAGGAAVLFREGRVLRHVRIHANLAAARWVLLDLGAGQPTREAIAVAQEHRARLGETMVQELTLAVTAAAEDAARALAEGDLATLADAIDRAGLAMEPLGVVDTAMRHVLSLAHEAGALAAKQTGAGLGGMLLALAPDEAVALRILALTAPHLRSHWNLPVHLPAPSPPPPVGAAPSHSA